jgi:hypothetical protein
MLNTFIRHTEVSIKLLHRSEIEDRPVRGYEEHPEEAGKNGYYVEKDKSESFTITKLAIPDCYEIVGKGYLRVPDLKTSVYLRSKGDTFTCRCSKYDDEYWDVQENIPEIDVNAP